MSSSKKNQPRLRALTVATAVAVSSLLGSAAAAERANVSGLAAADGAQQFIVKFRESRNSSRAAAQDAVLQRAAAGLARAGAASAGASRAAPALSHLRTMAIGAEVVRANRKLDAVEAAALIRQIAADPNVEYVEPDLILRAVATPNDTRYNEQWHYADTAAGAKVASAWDRSTGSNVVVAVLDTGITNHSDLNANILPGYDFISSSSTANDGNGRDNDPSDPGDACWMTGGGSSWHGTHVAGTVAAVTNNSKGVAGVAYNAKVVPVRVLGVCGGSTSDIADAIVWASGGTVSGVPANANPAEVINLSLGGSGSCGSTMQSAITGAVGRGTSVVIAAGNSNNDVSGFTPANCNNVITVGANDQGGKRAWYSNYGTGIDITAPGGETCSPATEFLPLGETPNSTHCAASNGGRSHPEQGVLSTLNSGTGAPGSESYAFYQGTSMAAPHVAGIVALMQAAASTPKTPAQIQQILADTARPIAAANCPGGCGPGIVDADAAVAAAAGGGTPGNQAPVANFSSSVSGLTVSFTDSSSDSDGSIASRSWDFGDGTSSTATSPSKTYSAAGTYTVKLTVTDDDGASNTKTATVTVGSSGGVQTYTNGTDVTIRDNATVESSITVSGRTGNAPSDAKVSVNIIHTYRGDLKVDLVAPDGSLYNISNRSGGSADNISGTFTFNLSSEALNGTWKLRVNDNAYFDSGRIDTWSITF